MLLLGWFLIGSLFTLGFGDGSSPDGLGGRGGYPGFSDAHEDGKEARETTIKGIGKIK
jgi:hypothetical protein